MLTARAIHLIARWVLVWFGLSLAVAVASPLVAPQRVDWVCSATAGMVLVVQSDDGHTVPLGHGLDCPLCANLGAPPPAWSPTVPGPMPLGFASLPVNIARLEVLLRGPWQARAPPVIS